MIIEIKKGQHKRKFIVKNNTSLYLFLSNLHNISGDYSPCQFENGKCIYTKNFKSSCCFSCGRSLGFYDANSYFLDDPKKIFSSYGFNYKYGFFKPMEGCKIPRHLRSRTCLTYICNNVKKEISPSKKSILLAYNLLLVKVNLLFYDNRFSKIDLVQSLKEIVHEWYECYFGISKFESAFLNVFNYLNS